MSAVTAVKQSVTRHVATTIRDTDLCVTYRGPDVPTVVDRVGTSDGVVLQRFVVAPQQPLIMGLPLHMGFYGGEPLIEWIVSVEPNGPSEDQGAVVYVQNPEFVRPPRFGVW